MKLITLLLALFLTMPTYSEPQRVTPQTSTPGAVVRYTLDGSDPNPTSPQVTGPITVNSNRVIKAKAFKAGLIPSQIAALNLTIATSIIYGYSELETLTESQLNAISNAPGTNTVQRGTITGDYVFGSGADNTKYFYFWFDDALNDPIPTTGFKVKSSGYAIAMAGTEQGYTATVNGFGYRPLVRNGRPGKLFRTFYPPGAGSTVTVTGD